MNDIAKPHGGLAEISILAQSMQALELEIAVMLADLKAKNAELERIASADLPDLMESLQLSSISLSNGDKVTIKKVIKASLPSAGAINTAKGDARDDLQRRLNDGLSCLREQGAEAMIKNMISADLGKGNDEIADKLIKDIESYGLYAQRSSVVHPQTLAAWVREKLEQGMDISFDLFSIYSGHKAVITKPR